MNSFFHIFPEDFSDIFQYLFNILFKRNFSQLIPVLKVGLARGLRVNSFSLVESTIGKYSRVSNKRAARLLVFEKIFL